MAATAAAVGCASLQLPQPAAAEPALPKGFQDSVAIDGLQQPTAFRFAPEGRIFVAEKAGRIKVYDSFSDPEPDLFADLRTDVYDHGDRGLLGLAIDPGFDEGMPYVYALYTYDHILGDPDPAPKWGTPETSGDSCPEPKGADDCLVSGRLVRLTAEESEGKLQAETEGGMPLQHALVEDWCQQFSSHSIGDLRFGPEGALYASGGDGASFTGADYGQLGEPPNPCEDPGSYKEEEDEEPPVDAEGGSLRAQNLENLSGSLIRIDPETGEAWPDNPLVASEDANRRRVVAYGFRNPFRFTADPVTGEIYVGNVGSSEVEEIDRFAAPPTVPYNSGWPCYEGYESQFLFKNLGFAVCDALYATGPGSTEEPLAGYSHKQEIVPGDECPISYGSALGGLAFYEGSQYPPEYQGALFFADAVRGCIYAMFPGEDGRPDPETTIRFLREGQIYPGVDIQEGPDGALYYADLFGDEAYGPGAIHRISYDPSSPVARLSADPRWGDVEPEPLDVTFDAGGSTDPDEEALTYDWDLDGDGNFELEGTDETQRSLELTEATNRTVAVRVTDGEELTSVARVTVFPGDSPPVPHISGPEETLEWTVGDEIEFHGSATDASGDPLYGRSLFWSILLAHCPDKCHKHPLQTAADTESGSFTAPDHDLPSYIEVNLRATDKRGLAFSETVRVNPRTVDLDIGSEPPGISLTAGLEAKPTPFSVPAIEDAKVVIGAPQTAQLDGRTYTWQRWSDGGARIHTVDADSPKSYLAVYSADDVTPPTQPVEPPSPPLIAADHVPPRTWIRKRPRKRERRRFARFAFASNEKGARFRCRLDRQPFRACRSPRAFRHLGRRWHVFRVFAIDAAGNRDRSPATFRWTIKPTAR